MSDRFAAFFLPTAQIATNFLARFLPTFALICSVTTYAVAQSNLGVILDPQQKLQQQTSGIIVIGIGTAIRSLSLNARTRISKPLTTTAGNCSRNTSLTVHLVQATASPSSSTDRFGRAHTARSVASRPPTLRSSLAAQPTNRARLRSRYWYRTPGAQPRNYSTWLVDSLWATHLVHPDREYLTTLLPEMVKNHEGWQQRHFVPAVGLYWQTGHDDGMEFNINSRQTQDILRGAPSYRLRSTPTCGPMRWRSLELQTGWPTRDRAEVSRSPPIKSKNGCRHCYGIPNVNSSSDVS